MERNARRYKNKGYPKLPKGATDLIKIFSDKEIAEKYGLNLRKTKPFYIDTVVQGREFFTVFASHQIIKLVEQFIAPKDRTLTLTFMLDGTFKIVPIKKYYQLLIIHIQYGNDVNNIFL